jgi:hypothetical protein
MSREKITESVKLHLSETEFNDLARLAHKQDRSISELLRVCILRPFLYGHCDPQGQLMEGADRGD